MKIIGLSDRALIRNFLSGEESAFETLIMRYKDRVFSQLIIMLKDRELAEDLFQDTFIKVVNTLKAGKYNEEGKFLPWVLRIAHNLAIDHFRRIKKRKEIRNSEEFDLLGNIPEDNKNIEECLVTDQIHDDVKLLVDLLPKEQKQVVKLRMYLGLSFKEISEETDVSINTSLGRMRYALINLRKLIDERQLNLNIQ